jgi:hypothetical protein
MDDQPRYRTLEELPEYTAQFDSIVQRYSEEVIGPVLAGLMWGIATNPQAYNQTTWNIRIAKSRSLGLTIPTFRIFFQLLNEGKESERVLLCWIEETNTIEEITEYLM